MLKRLSVKNFTVFADADFVFGLGLNVVVGTNGTGKSHVLKLGYAVEAALNEVEKVQRTFSGVNALGAAVAWSATLYKTLPSVFLSEQSGNLIRRMGEEGEATVRASWGETSTPLEFKLWPKVESETASTSHIAIEESKIPLLNSVQPSVPIFIPPKEVLSLFSWLPGIYDKFRIDVDRTYTDLCNQLNLPLLRELSFDAQHIIEALNDIMGGSIRLENNRFYFYPTKGSKLEIGLMAEGIRKFGILAYLLSNGSLTTKTTLYWDEPEANLNPALLKQLAAVLAELARQGFQIILATHSSFLLKQLHILSRQPATKLLPIHYFGLNTRPDGATQVTTTSDFEELPDIVALDEELVQAGEFLGVLNDNVQG